MRVDVTYNGLFGEITRSFPNRERAEQWARQVGVFRMCRIEVFYR